MVPQGLFFRPWSKLTVAAVVLLMLAGGLLTAAPWLDGQPAVQAQDDRGAVSNLSVSSPNPGQLVVAWSAPSETPTDYRVRWAPSGQDYLSFSEPNTSERGSAYPTGTSHTVSSLAAGASYKVQVRARYNGGEHADNPWSGPWSDGSHRHHLQPSTAATHARDHPRTYAGAHTGAARRRPHRPLMQSQVLPFPATPLESWQ